GQMPPHSLYVEAFFGSSQIFHRKRPAAASVVIDVDSGVIAKARAACPGATVIHGDALEALPTLTLTAEAVLYCDPPYLLSTRQGRFYYDHEMSEDQHARLLALLQGLKCRVL